MYTLLEEISKCGGFKSLVGVETCISCLIAIIALLIGLFIDYQPPISVFIAMFTSSAAMLGLIIASYSLVLNAGDKDFKKVFYGDDSFMNLRVDFSMTSIYLGCSAIINLLISLFYNPISLYMSFIVPICVFLCILGLLSIVVLMTNSLRLLGQVLSL